MLETEGYAVTMFSDDSRPTWDSVMPELRVGIARKLGSQVISAEPVAGAFGLTAAFRLLLEDGRAIFCKADHQGNTPLGRAAVDSERLILESVPAIQAFSPRFLGSVIVEDVQALLLEFIADRLRIPPWSDSVLQATLARILELHALELSGPFFKARWEPIISWRGLLSTAEQRAGFRGLFTEASRVEDWLRRHGDRLLRLEDRSAQVEWKTGALHMDLRSDNILYSVSRGPLLVDWPYLMSGPRAMDLGFFAASVEAEGGPEISTLIQRYETAWGHTFSRAELQTASVLVAGFFAARAPLPAIPGLPRLRSLQKSQLFPALKWMCRNLEMEWPEESEQV